MDLENSELTFWRFAALTKWTDIWDEEKSKVMNTYMVYLVLFYKMVMEQKTISI